MRWVVDFRDGNGRRHWIYCVSRDHAKQERTNVEKRLQQHGYRAPSELPGFQQVAAEWLATKMDRRMSTYTAWQTQIDLHLLPSLGPHRIDRIGVEHIEALRQNRLAAGLSPQTVNKVLTTLAAIFKYAMRRELTHRNPAAVVERCRTNAAEVTELASDAEPRDRSEVDPRDVLSPDEVARLVAYAEPGFYQAFLLTVVLTGARVGELTALRWEDIDFTAGTIAIRRSVSWAKPRGAEGRAKPRFYEPKTRHSRRTIPMAPELASTLKRWKLASPKNSMNLVFASGEGKPKHRSTITHEGLRPALRRAKLQQVNLHSLRHSFASALIMNGHPVTEIAALLGHSNPGVTLKVYSHWFRDMKTDAVASLARMICGPMTRGLVVQSGSTDRSEEDSSELSS